ncbi:hypothetical protein [Amycolatopsis sp. NPDC021455]|uniref:hypothetical protein n=1 Tax=Amycolatopsis sp. NPDC021455 TaxID=3154901 RepID=UPI0033E571FF
MKFSRTIAFIAAVTGVLVIQPVAHAGGAPHYLERTSGNGCTVAGGTYKYDLVGEGRYDASISGVFVKDKCDAKNRIKDGYGGTMRVVYRQWTGSAWTSLYRDFALGADGSWDRGDGAYSWGEYDVADVRFQACNRNESTGYVGTCTPI